MSLSKKLDMLTATEQKIKAKRMILLEKALQSENTTDLIKANNVINSLNNGGNSSSERKSYVVDPFALNRSLGYKDKNFSLSYRVLARMARTPIVNSIIRTRVNQIAAFAEPQRDRHSTGFVIQKRLNFSEWNKKQELTKSEHEIIDEITMFIQNCGNDDRWISDNFDTMVRKYMYDSFQYDQATFEVVPNHNPKRFVPAEFLATDASTFRIAESYDDDEYQQSRQRDAKAINGYYPSYVQLKQGTPSAEFYPWELSFGVRNPVTNIHNAGYGQSELEIMINIVTSMLWTDEYNRRFFSQGSMPKGFLKYKGALEPSQLQRFKQAWQSMMSGVYNSHKTPVFEGEQDLEWIDLQKSNREMEFSNYQEYLIKLGCAIYLIDPAEINFPLSGGAEQKAMFEGSNEARLKHSRDKGLYPALKFLQHQINKYIVWQIDPRFELKFVGLNTLTPEQELEMHIKKLTNFMTINEIREEYNLDSMEGVGDNILNGVFSQLKVQDQMLNQQLGEGEEADEFDGESEFDEANETKKAEEDNPFLEGFNTFFQKSLAK